MFATLAAAAALGLTPAQTGALNLTNVRTTYGELGAVRSDNRYLPGDLFFVAFDIDGITLGADGKVAYAMSMEVTDKAGKVVYKPDKPAESNEYLPLGGSKLPARAYILLDTEQAPGTYLCKVTVTDRNTKATRVLERPFEVTPKAFGIIQVVTSSDEQGGLPMPPQGVVGQNLFIHHAVVGFARDAAKKPNVSFSMRIYDDARRPTLTQPLTLSVRELDEKTNLIPVRYLVPFNREGNFTAELKATDNISGKTSTVTIPIRVAPSVR